MNKTTAATSVGFNEVSSVWRFIFRATLWTLGLLFVWVFLFGTLSVFTPATNRSKRAAAFAWMRDVSVAIESYAIVYDAYPAWSASPHHSAFILSGDVGEREKYLVPTFAFTDKSGRGISHLTTPLAYIGKYPLDPFPAERNITFAYWSTNADEGPGGWILWSCGPDRDYDLRLDNVEAIYLSMSAVPSERLINLTYDPTNGSESNGDIYRVKQ